jgi:hypothetical protein
MPESTVDLVHDIQILKAALWQCYVLSGADTDGDDKFYGPAVMAAKMTVESVRELRGDYEALLHE